MCATGGGSVSGQISALQSAEEDGSTGLWFVQLEAPIDTFRARAKDSGIQFSERYVYQRVWKGLSVQATEEAASMLGALRGVTAVFPVLAVAPEPVDSATPEMRHALAMTGADVAQNTLGLSGEGIKVAVMDSGIRD